MSKLPALRSELRTFPALLVALMGGLMAAAGTVPALAQGRGDWTRGTPMPSERTEVAAAEVGGRIFVVGGFGGQRELEIYDPGTDRWSRGATFPHAVHHAAAVGLNGKLYVVGGYVGGWSPSDAAFVYDPATSASCEMGIVR
jgi:Kelch motif